MVRFLLGHLELHIYRSPIIFLYFAFLCHSTAIAGLGENECTPIKSQGGQIINLNKSGRYCLNSDLQWNESGAAIRISASHVTIDFRGHRITGHKEVKGQIALLIYNKVTNITIKNGVVQYFHVGLRASDVQGITVKNMKFDYISWFGSHLSGVDISIEGCTFSNIGYKHGAGDKEAYAVGVLVFGQGIVISGSIFENVIRPPVEKSWVGEGVSVLVSEGSDNIKIHDNSFYVEPPQRETSIGVWLRASNIDFRGNKITNFGRPIEGHFNGNTKILSNMVN